MRIVPRKARTRTGGGVGEAAAVRRRGTDILALTILRAIRFRRYPLIGTTPANKRLFFIRKRIAVGIYPDFSIGYIYVGRPL